MQKMIGRIVNTNLPRVYSTLKYCMRLLFLFILLS